MSSDLMLDLENQHCPMMDGEEGFKHLTQAGDWDVAGFDLDDATELFDALQNAGYASDVPELDFDLDLPLWNDVNTSSIYTDGEVSVESVSPAHTFSSAPSPGSMGSFSPYSTQDEALSPQSQPSPVSVCSDLSGTSEVTLPFLKSPRKSTSRAVKPAQPAKRPIHYGPKVCIQPKPVIAAVPVAAAPLQAKTIIIQPIQTSLLPVIKQTPINIQPAPPQGHPIVLSQPSQLLQINAPQTVTGNVVTIPTLERPVSVAAPSIVPVTLKASSDDDSKFSQRQQRMIKNRESASLSRKKKKDYLFSLEARLKMALSENEVLKSENGNLKRQLEGLLNEQSTALNSSAPKRRAVCLMVILVFVVLNIGPLSRFQDSSGLEVVSVQHSRHLLGFSAEQDAVVEMSSEPLGGGPTKAADSSEDKALMVVKDPVFIRPPPPCQPPVNRTKCIELAHELRGWVHRHEVQQTKSRRMSNRLHKPTRTILKTPAKDVESGHIMTVQYTEPAEDRLPGSELQVYYAPRNTYSDFFDELNRRGDTFYVVSFRRDHLLLPATHHNKGRRPKMSLVLPAMNINDSVIRDQDHEVMMQIDCEVTNTRIINIRSSTIPPLLRVNRTETLYRHAPADDPATPPVGVLVGSV